MMKIILIGQVYTRKIVKGKYRKKIQEPQETLNTGGGNEP